MRRQRDDYRAMYQAAQLLSGMGCPGEAADLYQGFLRLEPLRLHRAWNPDRERGISQEARKRLCLTLRQLGRPGEAIEVCRAGLAADPASMDFLVNLGLALGEAGRHQEALDSERRIGKQLLTNFHRSVTSLVRKTCDLEDAYRAICVVQAARRSHDEGRRVAL